MKKNFWNNWDFKTIVQIILTVGSLVWFFATISGKVSAVETKINAIEKQRDEDIETVKTIRNADMQTITNDMEEIKDMLKELRNDVKTKKDK